MGWGSLGGDGRGCRARVVASWFAVFAVAIAIRVRERRLAARAEDESRRRRGAAQSAR